MYNDHPEGPDHQELSTRDLCIFWGVVIVVIAAVCGIVWLLS